MRLLADENVHGVVVRRLRDAGLEVEWVAETQPGASDAAILGRADVGSVVLLTYDRDFGDLIFNRGYPHLRAILYCRIGRADPRHAADRILALVQDGVPHHHIVTIARDGERIRAFPDGADNGRL